MNAPLVIALLVGFGVAVTLAFSRLARVRLTSLELLLTLFGTAAVSSTGTVLAYIAFTSLDCPPGWLCDYPGMFGAGLAFGAMWLACYCLVYVAAAFLASHLQARSRVAAGALTPNTSFERTREG